MNHLTRQLLGEVAVECAPEPVPAPVPVPESEPEWWEEYEPDWNSSGNYCYDGSSCMPNCNSCMDVDDAWDTKTLPEPDAVWHMFDAADARRRRVVDAVLSLYDTTLVDTHVPVLCSFRYKAGERNWHPVISLSDNTCISLVPIEDIAALRITNNMTGLDQLPYDKVAEVVFHWEMGGDPVENV